MSTTTAVNATLAHSSGGAMYYIRQFITFFGSYIMIAIIVFGSITNLLSMLVFYRRRKKDRVSAQFLGPLALVDFLNLTVCALPTWLYDNLEAMSKGLLKMDRVVGVQTDLDCQFYLYFWLIFAFISSWFIVSFSAERALVVWFPLQMQPIVSSSRPRKVALLTIVIFPFILFLVIFRNAGIRALEPDAPHRRQCAWAENLPAEEQVLHASLFIVIANGVPCLLIIILNILLLLGLKCHTMKDKTSTSDLQSKAEMKIIKNLMLISLFYTIFTSPYIVIWSLYLYKDLTGFEGYSVEDAGNLGRLSYFSSSFICMNYGTNGLVYVVSLDYYREECKRIFTCGLWRSGSTNKAISQATMSESL